METKFVIMKKGLVMDEKFFNSEAQARNYIAFKYPKRRWKKPSEREYICSNHGTKLKIVELYNGNNNSQTS